MGGQVNSAHHPSEGPNPNGERDVVEYRVSGANTLFPNKAWERGSRSYANPINAQARAHTHTLPISEPQETSVIVLQEKENPALKLLTEAVLRAQEEISDVKLDPDFVAGIVKRARIAHSRWIGRKVNICMIYPCYEGIHAGISNQLQSQIYTVLAGVMVGARYIAPVNCAWGRTGYHRDQSLGHFTKKLDQRRLLNFSHFLSRMETLGIQRVESCDDLPRGASQKNTVIHHVNESFTAAAYDETFYNYQHATFPKNPRLRVDPAPWPGMVGKRGDFIETFEARYIKGVAKSIQLYEETMANSSTQQWQHQQRQTSEDADSVSTNNSKPEKMVEYNMVVDVQKEAFWHGSVDLYMNYKQGAPHCWCDLMYPTALFGTVLEAYQLQVPNQLAREKSAYFSSRESSGELESNFAVAHLRIELDWQVDKPADVVETFLRHLRSVNKRKTFTSPWILMSGVFTDEKLMGAALRIADDNKLSTAAKRRRHIRNLSEFTSSEKEIVEQLTLLEGLKRKGIVDFVTHLEARFNQSFGDLDLEERAIFQMAMAIRADYFYASTSLSSASTLVENMRRIEGKPTFFGGGGHGMGFFSGLRGCSLFDKFETYGNRTARQAAHRDGVDCRARPLTEEMRERYKRFWEVEAAPTDFKCSLRDAAGRKIMKV